MGCMVMHGATGKVMAVRATFANFVHQAYQDKSLGDGKAMARIECACSRGERMAFT